MSSQHHNNQSWAEENGYKFHAISQGPIAEGASSLDIFRRAESYGDHVLGNYRNRAFEILDVRVEEHHGDTFGYVWRTIILVSTAGLKLPNFDIVPRSEGAGGLKFLGIKGLDLKLAPTATRDERELVDGFNKNCILFGGGAHESMEASIKSAPHLVPSLADMLSICKPSILRFFSTANTGIIEVQNGYLAIRALETRRIISSPFNDVILTGSERESLLITANDLLDAFAIAANEAPLPSLMLENTFRPAQFLGTIIGIAGGFFLGVIASIILLFAFKGSHLYLVPVLLLAGIFTGRFIGKLFTRAK